MKSTLFLVVLVSVQVYGGLLNKLNTTNFAMIVGSCVDKQKISPEQIIALSTLQSPTDTSTQCFLACVAKQSGIMNLDNSFDRTNMIKGLNSLVAIGNQFNTEKQEYSTPIINSIADSCTSLPTISDECVAAKNGFDCFIETTKTAGL